MLNPDEKVKYIMLVENLVNKLRILLAIIIMLTFLVTPFAVGEVYATGAVTAPCDIDTVDPNCDPPQLQEIEYFAVRILYIIWAAGGLVFLILMIIIGFTWMTSGGDEGKIATAKKRAGQWIVGFLLYFLSQPIVGTLMKGLIAPGDKDCFKNLNTPGFTFFFADVCTEGDQVDSNEETGILSADDGIGGCCTPGTTNAAEGCYPPASSLDIGYEACSTSNGACASGESCTITSVNRSKTVDLNETCRCRTDSGNYDEGRTVNMNDGQLECTRVSGTICRWLEPVTPSVTTTTTVTNTTTATEPPTPTESLACIIATDQLGIDAEGFCDQQCQDEYLEFLDQGIEPNQGGWDTILEKIIGVNEIRIQLNCHCGSDGDSNSSYCDSVYVPADVAQ